MEKAEVTYRFVDLCAGIGGIRLGFESIGWECVFTSEWDKFSQQTYSANFQGDIHGDLTKIDVASIPEFDCLTAGFPCFPRGTLILTKRGLIDIAEVREGDEVLTHLSRWRKVIRHHGSHMAPTISLNGQGHPRMVTTVNHPFLSTVKHIQNTHRNGDPVYVTTFDELSWTDAKDMRGRSWASPLKIEIVDRPASPSFVKDETKFYWCLGRWLADGWTVTYKRKNRKNSYATRVLWCSAKHEADELSLNLEMAGIKICRSEEPSVVKFIKQSNELFTFMEPFGKMAYGKTVPNWILTAPEHLRLAFLTGYLTGDGMVIPHGQRATTVSKSIAIGIKLLAIGLGFSVSLGYTERPPICEIEGRQVNQRDTWQIAIYDNGRRSSFELGEYRFGLVRSVTETGIIQEVFNFEVEEDNSYVADGIVVHNCQSFSIAGHKKGFEDTRGTIVFNIASILEHHKPTVVFLENVPNLLGHDCGNTFKTIIRILNELGYRTYHQLLNAKDFGVPQTRSRIYIVGFKSKDVYTLLFPDEEFRFPIGPKTPTRIRDILEPNPNEKYTLSDNNWNYLRQRKIDNKAKGKGFGYILRSIDDTHTRAISARYGKDGSEILLEQNDKNPRMLTPREAARLQGFPESFIIPVSDTQAYKQFGNSVAVPVIKAIAEKIKEYLENATLL